VKQDAPINASQLSETITKIRAGLSENQNVSVIPEDILQIKQTFGMLSTISGRMTCCCMEDYKTLFLRSIVGWKKKVIEPSCLTP
jgi:hypothetical protein